VCKAITTIGSIYITQVRIINRAKGGKEIITKPKGTNIGTVVTIATYSHAIAIAAVSRIVINLYNIRIGSIMTV
jgi:hypothetical protein